MAEYIEREAAIDACFNGWNNNAHDCAENIRSISAADVRPVVACTNCEHNNACLTQAFVEDCGKIPLDRNTFFCADGERADDGQTD